MSTNNNKLGIHAWHRLVVVAVLSLAVVLMIVAGVRTEARDANVDITAPQFQGFSPAPVPAVEALAAVAQTGKKAPQPAKPATPPAPTQPAAPPAPPARSDEVPATAPVAPPAPAVPTPATPATAPAPPAPPDKQKFKSKNKEKQKDDKRKVAKGSLIEAPQPVYPDEARAQGTQGEVSVKIIIGEDGNVISAKPTTGPAALHDAARNAALKARFKPTLVNGSPARVAGVLSYNFTLDKK